MTDANLDVALCQYGLAGVGTVDRLVERASSLLDRAGPADLYVLPELFAVDAATPSEDELPALSAEAFAVLREWAGEQARARDAVVLAGSAYVESDDATVNRSPVATPDGTVVTYDKCRPTPEERDSGVAAGDGEPPLVDCRGTTVGVLVCYDVEFPALVRDVVDRGAEVLAVPSWTASEAGYQRVRRCGAARAVENQVYVAQVSLVGDHPEEAVGSATGRSTLFAPTDDVVGPDGTRLSLARDEHAAATGRLDVGALRRAREDASVRPYTDRGVFDDE